jgi:hypothetical protein
VSRGTHAPVPGRTAPRTTGLSPAAAGASTPFARVRSCSLPEAPAGTSAPAVQPPRRIGLPATQRRGFGLLRVRSPLLTESRLISCPPGTEMFQFPGCPLARLCIRRGVPAVRRRGVPPFGYPWIDARWQLPRTFRRLPRPSSAPGAQASPVCPYSLLSTRSALHRRIPRRYCLLLCSTTTASSLRCTPRPPSADRVRDHGLGCHTKHPCRLISISSLRL